MDHTYLPPADRLSGDVGNQARLGVTGAPRHNTTYSAKGGRQNEFGAVKERAAEAALHCGGRHLAVDATKWSSFLGAQ
jgi:hypothetical protein